MPYAPTSRRPIAEPFRRTADLAVRLCVRWGVHPDTVSYLSVAAAAGAAACFLFASRHPALLLAAPLLCLLRLWFNMLDGMVALASGKASPRGEIVNELPDRVSDVLIFAGVAHSGLANPFLAYWAAIFALLTAYVGTLGQAVTGKRRFEGFMSKQWRMVVVAVAAVVMWVAMRWGTPAPPRVAGYVSGFSVIDAACALVIVGCVQTVWVRLSHTLADLKGGRE
jgi:phosphatidylglycerophosphate synthase